MDRLNAMTAPQKAILLLVILAIVAGGFWQLLISEAEAELAAAHGRRAAKQREYDDLRQYEKSQRLEEVRSAKETARLALDENKRMLPSEEEIPSFIKAMQADAVQSGLEILRFERGDAEVEDYYKRIPVRIEVLGRTVDVINLFQTLAAPKKRIVNVREFDIRKLPIDMMKIMEAMGEGLSAYDKSAMQRRQGKEKQELSVEEKRLLKLKNWQVANEMNRVRAEFTAYTFSYTGEKLSEEERKRRKVTRRRRR